MFEFPNQTLLCEMHEHQYETRTVGSIDFMSNICKERLYFLSLLHTKLCLDVYVGLLRKSLYN